MSEFSAKKYEEYRGISDVVIAEMLTDTEDELTYGEVIPLAGTSELTKETETSQESHYYDNKAALVVTGEGEDKLKLNISALALDRLALITGRHYDAAKGMFLETPRKAKYFALGYKTGLTGDSASHDRWVWRYKVQFTMPNESFKTATKDPSGEGQSLECSAIYTNKLFDVEGETDKQPLKALVMEDAGLVDLSTYFDHVTLPDEIEALPAEG